MEYKEIIEKAKPEFKKIVDVFQSVLGEIQTSRLSPSLVENIKVDCFGSSLPLKQLGAIFTPSFREIAIQLWTEDYVEPAVKEIRKRNLSVGIKVEGKNIYLTGSSLTEEGKRGLIRILGEKKEESFQNIRRHRDKIWKNIQEAFQKGEIGEDDKYKGKEELENVTGEYKKKIDELTERKKKEIEA